MSYATTLLKYPFDYGALRKKHPRLEILNPLGTCFTMSARWAKELLNHPSLAAPELARMLEAEIEELAPIHQTYIKETAGTLPQDARNKGYVKVFDGFKLRSPTLRGAQDDWVPGVSRTIEAETDWDGCTPGDMWGFVYKWIMKGSNTKHMAVLLADDKHTVGVFLPKGNTQIRVWDMNAGEFLLSGRRQWMEWAAAFETNETGDPQQKIQEVTMIEVGRKV
jgi:hypothetical protein